ncbi:MAG: cytidylyltransferase domain-containing protein [Acidobacteriota bacterium]
MTTVAIVQARMGSTRLPGKVLAEIEGRPMLSRVLGRLGRARTLDAVVVATSTEPGDDPVAELGRELRVPVFRGSEEDVLDRYAGAARQLAADAVVRVTADCPLIDPQVVDRVVQRFRESGADYASNTLKRTYPQGLDVEVFRREALEQAAREAREPWERAHVTPYLYHHPERFALVSVTHDRDLSRHRWTVDTREDLKLVRALYRRADDPYAGWQELLRIAESDPSLRAINAGVVQKALEEG